MDASLEKSCLEEISHTVLDSQQKISVRSISNNYGLNFLDAVKILQQWLDKNGTKANLVKEFIVRGFDPKQGGAFITVVNEKKLKVVQSKVSRISSVLYAVEVAAESSRKLVIPEEQEFSVINLPLRSDKRDVHVFTPAANPPPAAAAAVKQESKSKIKSMFAAGASKPKQESPKPDTVKEEKQSPPAATGKKDTAKATSPQKSPSKGSPSKKKDAKKAVSGKASIASFFSNKPGASKPMPVASAGSSAAVEVKKEKESPKEAKEPKKEERMTNGKREDTPRWKRMISDESDGDDVIPNTPQAKKEPAKKGGRKTLALKKKGTSKANPSKRSRILQVVDSSEEEEEEEDETRNLSEPEERLIKFDVDESEDAEMKDDEDAEEKKKKEQQLSPEKPVENDSNSLNRKRAKVKKLVTKNYMDEEGYMTTIKNYVMVSASEDEDDGDASNNNTAEGKKATAEEEPVASGGGDKNSTSNAKPANKKPSKVTPPTPKTKQGSIMSFFSKK
ncbi:DNA polymerase delta subunit 3 [Ochlerotatus camptorhynchus]|uniref:DNA polymerase delta subunit 3 n=1 Tax=Ochlerotatus camptorhynchus TaxID=644619 RepID=UPI0031E1B28F